MWEHIIITRGITSMLAYSIYVVLAGFFSPIHAPVCDRYIFSTSCYSSEFVLIYFIKKRRKVILCYSEHA